MTPLDDRWIAFLRANAFLRESFLTYLAQVKQSALETFPNVKTQEEVWRLQGGIRAIDNITAFVSNNLREPVEDGRGSKAGSVETRRAET